MNFNIEKEYKCLVSKEQFETLLKYYPGVSFQTQTNTYFDTADLTVKQLKGAMRIREVKQQFLFTLKLPGKAGLQEFECFVPNDRITTFENHEEIVELLSSHGIHGPFQMLCQLTTKRGIVYLPNAELCFDINYYGDQCDYEIEYEWTKAHDGLTQFNQILAPIHLSYEKNCDSKIKRAMDALCKD